MFYIQEKSQVRGDYGGARGVPAGAAGTSLAEQPDTVGVSPGHDSGRHARAVQPVLEDVVQNRLGHFGGALTRGQRAANFRGRDRKLDGIEPFQGHARRRFEGMARAAHHQEAHAPGHVPPSAPRLDFGKRIGADEEEQFVEAVNRGFGWERLQRGDFEAWKAEDPPFTEEWVQVAEVNEKIVSIVVAKPDTNAIKHLHLNRGYLGPAATLPEFRNKHLASALTAQAMNFLHKKGMDSVILGTSEQNVSSIALLRSLGFRVENVRKILRKELRETRQPKARDEYH